MVAKGCASGNDRVFERENFDAKVNVVVIQGTSLSENTNVVESIFGNRQAGTGDGINLSVNATTETKAVTQLPIRELVEWSIARRTKRAPSSIVKSTMKSTMKSTQPLQLLPATLELGK
jgi:hypothetical protein